MGAAPKNWGLSQPPGAETAPSPNHRRIGGWGAAGQTPGAGGQTPGLGIVGNPWRQPERLGTDGKTTFEETVFGIMERKLFTI